ncbi:hypothetical protein BZL30_9012 [Mycobacterium kansasii]|uniref:Uncharacterized protein n=1 Tax=Mycobacterium kansasii TaxID=1768 RepID=A0A1V3WD37_MYCKA|nr:hypothetical protein BZL30_9012 [Mycobacterium kansasii]
MHGLDSFARGALGGRQHSGECSRMDFHLSIDFYDKFGYDRPVYTLSHDSLFMADRVAVPRTG